MSAKRQEGMGRQMSFSFRQQSVGETTYLVFDIDDDLEIDSFAIHMMEHNRIANIVQTQIVSINEKRQLQFNITGLIKLNNRISVPRPKKEVLGILSSILNAFEEVDAYMLDMEHLFLDWEYIYLDGQGNCMLMYLPFGHMPGKDKIVFLQEIVSRVQPDYQEKDPYLFDILNAFSRGAVQKLSDFGEIIKKNAASMSEGCGEEKKTWQQELKPETSPAAPQEKEEKAIPETIEKKSGKKSSGSHKIPVINIPGREPGAKEVPAVSDRASETREVPSVPAPVKKPEKKGFFGSFAVPKKQKAQEIPIPERESNKSPDHLEAVSAYEKGRQDDMYEGYENTVIMQEAPQGFSAGKPMGSTVGSPVEAPAGNFVLPSGEEGTFILTQQEDYVQTAARLIRRQDGTAYQINKQRVMVGSGTAADICIYNNNAISRNHAIITYDNGDYYIEDNQSKNGSFLNGRRLQSGAREHLYDGMFLKLANEDFIFRVNFR